MTFNNISRDEDATGILLDNTDVVVIFNNTVAWTEIGIYTRDCDDVEIAYNELMNNTFYGVSFGAGTSNGLVHNNNFYGNYDNDGQAYDSQNNSWDNGTAGNWWSDWNGTGDYNIGGPSDAVDNYPLGDPVVTGAPERVPEFGPMVVISLLAVALLAFRRLR